MPGNANSEKAQINIDYVAGMGIFLLSVAFVFQFMYSLFIPFQSGSEEATLAADRVSTVLVERILNAEKTGRVNMIDQEKLYYFNNTKLNHTDKASYEDALREVGLYSNETSFDLNISVVNLTDTPIYMGGPSLPRTVNIGQTGRFVTIVNSSSGYNEIAVINIRVW
ncbi:MAG TPA: hypothetical protein VIO11_03710 [Candidatus Methanoperedens sp.]